MQFITKNIIFKVGNTDLKIQITLYLITNRTITTITWWRNDFNVFPKNLDMNWSNSTKKQSKRNQLCQSVNQCEQNTKQVYWLQNPSQRLVFFFSLANTENDSFFEKVDLFLAQICFTLSSLSYNTINNSISFMTFIYSTIAKRWLSKINYELGCQKYRSGFKHWLQILIWLPRQPGFWHNNI